MDLGKTHIDLIGWVIAPIIMTFISNILWNFTRGWPSGVAKSWKSYRRWSAARRVAEAEAKAQRPELTVLAGLVEVAFFTLTGVIGVALLSLAMMKKEGSWFSVLLASPYIAVNTICLARLIERIYVAKRPIGTIDVAIGAFHHDEEAFTFLRAARHARDLEPETGTALAYAGTDNIAEALAANSEDPPTAD